MGRALVTGSGARLGQAMALFLAGRGFDVVVHFASSADGADETAKAIQAMGQNAVALQADLLDPGAVDGLIPRASTALNGPLMLLVNNASIFEHDTLASASHESWDHHFGSNLRAPFFLTQAFAAQAPKEALDETGEVTSRALHDSCSDVVGLGVKCLTPLFQAVTPAQAAPVMKLLLDGLRDTEAERREMGMHGLKATLSELDAGPEAAALLRASMPVLVGALQSGGTDVTGPADLQAGPLELLHLALQRFAGLVDPKLHDLLKDVVLRQLGDPRSAVRKRAVQALGSLAAALRGSSLDGLCADLLARLQGTALAPARRAFLQAVGAVAQSAGARAGSLAEAAPLCASYCRGAGEGEDELQEAALQALEALVQRLPEGRALGAEADMTALCLTCVAHDPNYSYSDDEGEAGCSIVCSSSDGEEMQEDADLLRAALWRWALAQ